MDVLLKRKNRGTAGLAVTIATVAIVLAVTVLVFSQMSATAGGMFASTTSSGYYAYANITNYTWLFSTAQHC